jgi:Zn-dependent protease
MAQALGVRVKAIGMCVKGAYIRRQRSLNASNELLIAASGPVANLILYLWFRDGEAVLRWTALMNLVLAGSNLIPISGTDGARILQSLKEFCGEDQSHNLQGRQRPHQNEAD